jgi:hypothetical protein
MIMERVIEYCADFVSATILLAINKESTNLRRRYTLNPLKVSNNLQNKPFFLKQSENLG